MGCPDNIIFTTLSVTLLLGVTNLNGTMEKMAKVVVYVTCGERWIIPFAFFVFNAIVTGTGDGTPRCSLLLPLATTIGVNNGILVMVMALMSMGGLMVGGLFPIALNDIVVKGLAANLGLGHSLTWFAYSIIMTVSPFATYVLFGHWKPKKDKMASATVEKFTAKQTIAMLAILIVLVGALFFKQDIGLLPFNLGAILILFNFADERGVHPLHAVGHGCHDRWYVHLDPRGHEGGRHPWLSNKVAQVMNSVTVYPRSR